MSTEFVTIKEAVDANKGNFIATVTKVGDLKSGTSKGKDWSLKKITVQDSTADLDITCFGSEEIGLFKLGGKYEIFPWWKELYEGKANVGIGKYGQIKLIGTDEINNIISSPTPEPSKIIGDLPQPHQEATKLISLKQKLSHDEVWAFALIEATKVYPLESREGGEAFKSRLILAQVFYKKNMDYIIHKGVV